MALQDLCGFQDSLDSKWNLQTASGGSQDGASTLQVLGAATRNNLSGCLFWSNPGNPLNFYVPNAQYLSESPVQFGQSRPSDAARPATDSPPDSILPALSLPAGLPLSSSPSAPLPFPLSHGTTTLAFLFQGGVIAAADTRSSCSGLVACPASQKILPVHSHLVGTTSGTSADCALWKRVLSRELRLYQLRHGRRLSTAGAAKLLSHMLHPFKGTELCMAATLCGWDGGELEACPDHAGGPPAEEEESGGETEDLSAPVGESAAPPPPPVAWRKSQCLRPGSSGRQCSAQGRRGFSGPSLYYVCSDGARLQGELFSVGSGSPYAYSVLDGGVRWGLSVEEAVSVAREAVFRATHRDAYSGNCVDLYHVTAQGWRRRPREELKEEYYREKEREREKVKERRETLTGIDCDHSSQK